MAEATKAKIEINAVAWPEIAKLIRASAKGAIAMAKNALDREEKIDMTTLPGAKATKK